jgi:hypothetical protein
VRVSGARKSVFLSYSRRDFYLAEQVYVDLRREGVKVWMDMAEIGPGEAWRGRLKSAIRAADTLLLVATPRSVRARAVRCEIEYARRQGTPVSVLVAEPCELPPGLEACPRYQVPAAKPSPVVALTVAALACTAFVYLALAAYYFWAAVTDDLAVHRQARWAAVPVLYAYYLGTLGLSCLTGAAVVVVCGVALVRRLWRVSYALPLVAVAVEMLMLDLVLPKVHAHVRNHAEAAAALNRAVGPLRAAMMVDTVIALAVIVVLLASTSVLRHSLTGAGSALARWRVWGGTKETSTALLSVLHDHVPIDQDDLDRLLEPSGRTRTFTLVHEPADAPIAARVRSACRDIGLLETPSRAEADLRLLLVSNVNIKRVLDESEVSDRAAEVPFLACSLDLPLESELMRRQWVDFRKDSINVTESAHLTRRAPKKDIKLGMVVPINALAGRMPGGVHSEVFSLALFALGFGFLALSNTYWNVLGARPGMLRLGLALGIAVVAADIVRAVAQRRTSSRRIRRERLLLAVLCCAFAVVTWFDDSLWTGFRLVTIGMALGPVVQLVRADNDLEMWLPVAPAPATPPARGFPVTMTATLLSPYFHAALGLAVMALTQAPP